MATPINGSVQLGFSILRQFATPGGAGYTLTEIARRMDLPIPTVHRFLKTLAAVGALAPLPGGRYALGAQLADLGSFVPYENLLGRSAHGIVAELSTHLGAITHLSVAEGGMVKFIAKVSADPGFRVSTRVGGRFEAYCTASGKVLLAELPPAEFESYLFDGDLVPLTSETIVDPELLTAHLSMVRRRRLATDRQEFQEGVLCWAVPVANGFGRTVAALSASLPVDHALAPQDRAIATALTEASRAITASLTTGGRPI